MDLYNKLTSGLNATGQFFPGDLGPTRPTVEFGTALLAYPQTLRDRFMLGRVDHRISDRDQLSVRYGFDSQTSPTGGGTNFPGYFTSFAQRYNNSVITETHVFSPSLTNEFRLPYNRNVKVPDTGDVVPRTSVFLAVRVSCLGQSQLELGTRRLARLDILTDSCDEPCCGERIGCRACGGREPDNTQVQRLSSAVELLE